MTLLPKCLCGCPHGIPAVHHGVPTLLCLTCGLVRQDVRLTEAELADWYAAQYHAGVYTHSPDQDFAVANARLNAYGLTAGAKLLDVGAGNGAFVSAALARGIDAWGQDLAVQSDSDRVYVGALADIAFPTADFDVVTVHDVLEHIPDPQAFLAEIRRVLKPGGLLIVDFPRFWDDAGRHHWKLTEHLWMLTEDQLLDLLRTSGFQVQTEVEHPIPSKVVVRCHAPEVKRVNILVPAGIGDAYWVITKLAGFCRDHGIIDPPAVWVQDAGGPKRTEPFLRTIPSVFAAGYVPLRTKHYIWKEAYMTDGRTVYERPFTEALEIDWFIAYNGVMRFGKNLADVDPQWVPDWHPKMFFSKEAQAFKAWAQEAGPYCVAYFTDAGMYQQWLHAFTPVQIREVLRGIQQRLGLRMIFMGAEWDRDMTGERLAQYEDGWVDLVGETSYDQMLGLIAGASLVFGFPAGNTILGPALKIPTVMLWHGYFEARFWVNACAPGVPYTALNTVGLTVEAAIEAAVRMVQPQLVAP